jgi:pimeloyl-ACP methyl ester carboxylesterase
MMGVQAMSYGFVLIPGGGMSDWEWKKLIPLLKYDAVTVPRRIDVNNCETRLKAQIPDVLEYANRIIDESGFSNVVLVGHSGGGVFAGMLGKTNKRVRHVVFIAGNIPADGMSAPDELPEELRLKYIEAVRVQAAYDFIPMRVMEQTIRTIFCNTCADEDIDYVLNQLYQPEPLCVLEAKGDWSGYPDIGKTYIVCTKDGTLPESVQEVMAAHLGIMDIERISSDHMVMISHPAELANVLNSIIKQFV